MGKDEMITLPKWNFLNSYVILDSWFEEGLDESGNRILIGMGSSKTINSKTGEVVETKKLSTGVIITFVTSPAPKKSIFQTIWQALNLF